MPQAVELSAYSKRELKSTARAIRSLGDEAKDEAQQAVGKLTSFALQKIQQTAYSDKEAVPYRIAMGGRIRKKSLIAEIGFGFARQQLSGGATTQINERDTPDGPGILGGWEFGSKTKSQFPAWAKEGRFIYPTLRAIQPDIVAEWERVSTEVIRKWSRGR